MTFFGVAYAVRLLRQISEDLSPVGENERKTILDEVKDLLAQEHITGSDVVTLGGAVKTLIKFALDTKQALVTVQGQLTTAEQQLTDNALDTTGVVQATADVKAIDDNANSTLADIKALLEPVQPSAPVAVNSTGPGDGSAPAGDGGN